MKPTVQNVQNQRNAKRQRNSTSKSRTVPASVQTDLTVSNMKTTQLGLEKSIHKKNNNINALRKQMEELHFFEDSPNYKNFQINGIKENSTIEVLYTLEKLYNCLLYELPEVNLSKDIISKAKKPIERMLELG